MTGRDDLLRLARNEFAFLTEVAGCEVELIEPNGLLTMLAYKIGKIAVELHFDWRDLDVSCYISQLSGGHLQEGYLLRDGKRIRFRLSDLSPEVLGEFRRLPKPPKRRPPLDQWAEQQYDRMASYIGIYSGIINSEFEDLLSRAEAGFNEPVPE